MVILSQVKISFFFRNLGKIEEGIGDKVGVFLNYQSVFLTGMIWSLVIGWKLALVCMVSLPMSSITMAILTWVSDCQ